MHSIAQEAMCHPRFWTRDAQCLLVLPCMVSLYVCCYIALLSVRDKEATNITSRKTSGDNTLSFNGTTRPVSSASARAGVDALHLPRLLYEDEGKIVKTRPRCTAHELVLITQQKPHTSSNCPNNDAWMTALLEETADLSSVTIISVGCNKGDDFVSQMRDWSRNPMFSPSTYTSTQQRLFGRLNRACKGAAQTRHMTGKSREIRGFCIEPMPSNYKLLTQTMSALNYTESVTLIQNAISSTDGMTQFPNAAAGTESSGIGMGSNHVDVVMSTLDSIIESRKIHDVEFLSIDTEGNDMRAIIGCVRSLYTKKIRYFEFEYHNVARWAFSDLQDLIDILDQMDFACYWALNSGGLCRLTGCWHDMYYKQRTWSNVACINRASKHTYARMQEISSRVRVELPK